jgi:hypothetical protein
MTDGRSTAATRRPRHGYPDIDDLGLAAARHADRLLAEARQRSLTRWITFLAPLPDQLRDDELPGLRSVAVRARAAYGAKDSIREALPEELTEPFLEALDRLIREINREFNRARG